MALIYGYRLFSDRVMHHFSIAERDLAYYWMGAQGWNCFHYAQWEKPTREYNTFYQWLLQMTPSQLQAYIKAIPSNQGGLYAYYAGLQTYFALKHITLPFLEYSQTMLHQLHPEKSMDDCMEQITAALDVILLRYDTEKVPSEFPLKKAVPATAEQIQNISSLLVQWYKLSTHQNVEESMIQTSMEKGIHQIYSLQDTALLKKAWYRFRNRKKSTIDTKVFPIRSMLEDDDYDYANVCHKEWQWPINASQSRTESFLELYDDAIYSFVPMHFANERN